MNQNSNTNIDLGIFFSDRRWILITVLLISLILLAAMSSTNNNEKGKHATAVVSTAPLAETNHTPMAVYDRKVSKTSGHSQSIVNPFTSTAPLVKIKSKETVNDFPASKTSSLAPESMFHAEGYLKEPRVEGVLGMPPSP